MKLTILATLIALSFNTFALTTENSDENLIRKALVSALDGKRVECVQFIEGNEKPISVPMSRIKQIIMSNQRTLTVNEESEQPIISLTAPSIRLEVTTSSDLIDIVKMEDIRFSTETSYVNEGTIINPQIREVKRETVTSLVSCMVLNL